MLKSTFHQFSRPFSQIYSPLSQMAAATMDLTSSMKERGKGGKQSKAVTLDPYWKSKKFFRRSPSTLALISYWSETNHMTTSRYYEVWESPERYCCDWLRTITIFPGARHIAALNKVWVVSAKTSSELVIGFVSATEGEEGSIPSEKWTRWTF